MKLIGLFSKSYRGFCAKSTLPLPCPYHVYIPRDGESYLMESCHIFRGVEGFVFCWKVSYRRNSALKSDEIDWTFLEKLSWVLREINSAPAPPIPGVDPKRWRVMLDGILPYLSWSGGVPFFDKKFRIDGKLMKLICLVQILNTF